MAEKFDVFISYRRQGGRDIARILQLQLAQRGLRCFFDFDELQNGDFNEAIYEAIKSSKNFIVILSSGALERCINDGDWVRREIECALQNKINVVPVAPNDAPRAFPGKLPESLECLRKLQIAPLNMEDLLDASVDKIIRKNLVGIEIDSATGKVKGFAGTAKVSDEALLDLPKLGKAVPDVDLAVLDDSDKRTFKKAIRLYQTLRSRSALAEFRKIKNQDDPIVRYFVMRLAYEFEPNVDDAEFESVCIRARDLGSSDAMVVFAERNLNSESEFGVVPYGECISWLKKAIATGNPYAYVALAHAYEDGRGVAKNRRIAHLLFERSAEADCIGGRIGLAMDYASGDNVRENQMRAREEMVPALRHLQSVRSDLTGSDLATIALWYLQMEEERSSAKVLEIGAEMAAINGRCAAKNLNYPDYARYVAALAIVLDVAEHVAVSEEKKKNAAEMLQDICSHPHHSTSVNAPWVLGLCYQLGIGVEVDPERAFENFQIASDRGCDEATTGLANMYLQDGVRKNVSKARALLEEVASHGNASAQSVLGTQYARGVFGDPDYDKAKEWWLKAADGDDASAFCNLGQCFRDGLGSTEVDYKESARWFLKGAESGCTEAMGHLANAYLSGQGVPRSQKEAERLLQKAAKLGNAAAECLLGTCYYNGAFGMVNFPLAIMSWTHAAESGNTTAMCNLGMAYRNGEAGVQKDLQKALSWYGKAYDVGDAAAARELGNMYFSGDADCQDKIKAFAYFLESAQGGDAKGMFEVACSYRDGEGVEGNDSEAVYWFKKGAEAGYAPSMTGIANLYLNGVGVAEDRGTAERWMVKAAESGDTEAECLLGTFYANGDFGCPNDEKAVYWWRKAANHGDADAKWNLGASYMDGNHGLLKDPVAGFGLLEELSDAGHAKAMEKLAEAYMYGEGTAINVEKASALMAKAAESGQQTAVYTQAIWLLLGTAGEVDVNRAIEMLKSLAESGEPEAWLNLGQIYCGLFSNSPEVDVGRAVEYFTRADQAGVGEASVYLGANELGMLGQSVGTYDDFCKVLRRTNRSRADGEIGLRFRVAKSWFRKALDRSDGNAKVECAALRGLARLLRYEKDDVEASRLYCSAVEKGDVDARAELLDWLGPNALPSVSVANGLHTTTENRLDAEPLNNAGEEFSRKEEAFLHKAFRFLKRSRGDLSAMDEEKLETLAKELGIDAVRFEDLISQAESEYKGNKE